MPVDDISYRRQSLSNPEDDDDACDECISEDDHSSSSQSIENSYPEKDNNNNNNESPSPTTATFHRWSPSGSRLRDFLHFCGPGWIVCIAYVDPGNYQADINAGATSGYSNLWVLWWTSVLSIYVQILCVRLAYYAQTTLAEVQAANASSKGMRYLNWGIAEFSALITDIPEVIGIGIALNVFFGWPYYVGVLMSLLTTMLFLATANFGIRILEAIILFFVGVMSVTLWIEMSYVDVDGTELVRGWTVGFLDTSASDEIFNVLGIIGAVVMPHNLYLHTASCLSRRVERRTAVVEDAVKWSSFEPVVPIFVSFFVNMAIVSIAAETVAGEPDADDVGLTDFCDYFVGMAKVGCTLWGIALLAAGQSSAVTTTLTGQYVMDGFLNIRINVAARAIIGRLVVITPCVITAIVFNGKQLNKIVNYVNALLGILLPFALSPLVKFNCSEAYMKEHAAGPIEKRVLHFFAFLVWLVNSVCLSVPNGGFFGYCWALDFGAEKVFIIILQILIHAFTIWWQIDCFTSPVISPMRPIEDERPFIEGEFSIDTTNRKEMENDREITSMTESDELNVPLLS